MYDIPNKKYDYFVHTSEELYDTYTSVDTMLNEGIEEGNTEAEKRVEYKISKEEKTVTQNTLSGETLSYSKLNDYLIETDIEPETIDYEPNMDKKELKDSFKKIGKNFKKADEIITEEKKKEIEKKVQEVEQVKEKIEIAKEEIKADEERKAKEEAAKGIKAGQYRLKYGTYKSNITDYMGEFGGEYTIKQDGTFTYSNNWKDYDGNSCTNTASGTYKVEYANMKEIEEMPDDYKWVIIFTATSYSGKGRFGDPLIPNDPYYNVDSYEVTDNNKFQASQYNNVWTLVSE